MYVVWVGVWLFIEVEWEKVCVWDLVIGFCCCYLWGIEEFIDIYVNLGG